MARRDTLFNAVNEKDRSVLSYNTVFIHLLCIT